MKFLTLFPLLLSSALCASEQKYLPNLPEDAKQLIDQYHQDMSNLEKRQEIDMIDPTHGSSENTFFPYGPSLCWQGLPYYYWPEHYGPDSLQPQWQNLKTIHNGKSHDENDAFEKEYMNWHFAVDKDYVQLRKYCDDKVRQMDKNYRSIIKSIDTQDTSFQTHSEDRQVAVDRANFSYSQSLVETWYDYQKSFSRRHLMDDLSMLQSFYQDTNQVDAAQAILNEKKIIR